MYCVVVFLNTNSDLLQMNCKEAVCVGHLLSMRAGMYRSVCMICAKCASAQPATNPWIDKQMNVGPIMFKYRIHKDRYEYRGIFCQVYIY